MGFITITGIALSLAMDAFSVCVAAGVRIKNPGPGHYFRLSFHFGLFQFLMPVAGYYCGIFIEEIISSYDHWIALIILSFIGFKMIWESFSGEGESRHDKIKDPSRGITLVMLAIATSIDAAAVGFSLAALKIPILLPAVYIGIVCAFCSAAGLYIGNTIGSKIGARAERAGGLILILIGIKILLDHLSC